MSLQSCQRCISGISVLSSARLSNSVPPTAVHFSHFSTFGRSIIRSSSSASGALPVFQYFRPLACLTQSLRQRCTSRISALSSAQLSDPTLPPAVHFRYFSTFVRSTIRPTLPTAVHFRHFSIFVRSTVRPSPSASGALPPSRYFRLLD